MFFFQDLAGSRAPLLLPCHHHDHHRPPKTRSYLLVSAKGESCRHTSNQHHHNHIFDVI